MRWRWQMILKIYLNIAAPVGELLTLTAKEALEVGYSEKTIATFNELLKVDWL